MKTSLFRFASLRTPQLISDMARSLGFVVHPAPTRGYFTKGLMNLDPATGRQKATERLAGFQAIVRPEGIKGLAPELHGLALWLSRQKSEFTEDGLKAQTQLLKPVAPGVLLAIWDQLHSDLLRPTSPNVRQVCIQMIVADNLLRKMQDTAWLKNMKALWQERATPGKPAQEVDDALSLLMLRRLADVKVVISPLFSTPRQTLATLEPKPGKVDELLKLHRGKVARDHSQKLDYSIGELRQLDALHFTSTTKARDVALKAHEVQVGRIRQDFLKSNKLDRMNPLELRSLNPDSLPDLDLPEFSFVAERPLLASFTKGKLSAFTDALIDKAGARQRDTSSLIAQLGQERDRLSRKAAAPAYVERKRVYLGGRLHDVPTPDVHHAVITFNPDPLDDEQSCGVYLSLRTEDENPTVRELSSTLKLGTGDARKSTAYRFIDNTARTLTLQLFPDARFDIRQNERFEVQGQLTLDNGDTLTLGGQGSSRQPYLPALANLIAQPSDDQAGIRLYGVNRVGILDYHRVEQEVCCYLPGEVAHIENIMAREYREKHTRHLISTEAVLEDETSTESEREVETTGNERNELNTEVAAVLSKETSNNFGVSTGVSGSYYGVEMNVDAYIDFASTSSSSDSNSLAKTYATEVTERALERVVQKVTQKRTSRTLEEHEENNRHGFDNRVGDQHVTGVYRWVDKVYTTRLVNYGKRMVYEFLIPEPARFYKQAIQIQIDEPETSCDLTVLAEPKHPSNLREPIKSADWITESNYAAAAAVYGARVEPPPKAPPAIGETYSGKYNQKEDANTFMPPISVPAGFHVTRATLNTTIDWQAKGPLNDGGAYVNLSFAGQSFSYRYEGKRQTATRNETIDYTSPKSGTLSCAVSVNKVFTLIVSIDLTLGVDEAVWAEWRTRTYDAIRAAYDAKYQAYLASVEAAQQQTEQGEDSDTVKFSPRMNRQIEQTELKRIAIEMLTQPFGLAQGRGFYTPGSCHIPQVVQTPAWERYSSHVKFFEQAFDWPIMSYLFYPYYWAHKCRWIELFQAMSGNDATFSAFLQSGMARLVVPVRRGFEEAVIHYINTGEVWLGGGLVTEASDDLYLSIVDELREVQGEVAEQWEVTVPTSLTILQKDSAALDEGGLPCCDALPDSLSPRKIVSSTSKLGNVVQTGE